MVSLSCVNPVILAGTDTLATLRGDPKVYQEMRGMMEDRLGLRVSGDPNTVIVPPAANSIKKDDFSAEKFILDHIWAKALRDARTQELFEAQMKKAIPDTQPIAAFLNEILRQEKDAITSGIENILKDQGVPSDTARDNAAKALSEATSRIEADMVITRGESDNEFLVLYKRSGVIYRSARLIALEGKNSLAMTWQKDNNIIVGLVNFDWRQQDINVALPSLPAIGKGRLYHFKEVYSAQYGFAPGDTALRGARLYSEDEIRKLGLWRYLESYGARVFTVDIVDKSEDTVKNALKESLVRYKYYGRHERVKYNYASQRLQKALGDQKAFLAQLAGLIEIVRQEARYAENLKISPRLTIGTISTILHDMVLTRPDSGGLIRLYIKQCILSKESSIARPLKDDMVKIMRGMEYGEILIASAECRPIAGAGGLALYTHDYAKALSEAGLDVSIITMLYDRDQSGKPIHRDPRIQFTGREFDVHFLGAPTRSQIFKTAAGEIPIYAIYNNVHTARIYGDPSRDTDEDLIKRYRLFSLGVLEAARTMNLYPSVIQTNEGCLGWAAAYLNKYDYLKNDEHFRTNMGAGADLSVLFAHFNHNLDWNYLGTIGSHDQGRMAYLTRLAGFDPDTDRHILAPGGNSYVLSPTFTGNLISRISGTVSPGYRDYTKGAGTEISGVLEEKYKEGRYIGPQNGGDTIAWQRMAFGKSFFECGDEYESKQLLRHALKERSDAKRLLQKRVGLHENRDAMLISMMHRLCEQKGYELLLDDDGEFLKSILRESISRYNQEVQIVIAGPEDNSPQSRRWADLLHRLENDNEFKGRLRYLGPLKFNQPEYNLIYTGSDAFLMPSKFEPAGLSQLEAMARGTIVIANDIDGLKTSVTDPLESKDTGKPATGFKFMGFRKENLKYAILDRAVEAFKNRGKDPLWNNMIVNCLNYDSRWIRPVKENMAAFARDLGILQYTDMPNALEILLAFSEDTRPATRLSLAALGETYESGLERLKALTNDGDSDIRNAASMRLEAVTHPGADLTTREYNIALEKDIHNTRTLATGLADFYTYDAEKAAYTIRINSERIPADYIDLIKKYYCGILSSRCRNAEFKVIENKGIGNLIEVTLEIGGKTRGFAAVNMRERHEDFISFGRLVGMVNLAIAISNLPDTLSESDRDLYAGFIDAISSQYMDLTGEWLTPPEDPRHILSFIRRKAMNLPLIRPFDLSQQEQFRVMEEKLELAA